MQHALHQKVLLLLFAFCAGQTGLHCACYSFLKMEASRLEVSLNIGVNNPHNPYQLQEWIINIRRVQCVAA